MGSDALPPVPVPGWCGLPDLSTRKRLKRFLRLRALRAMCDFVTFQSPPRRAFADVKDK